MAEALTESQRSFLAPRLTALGMTTDSLEPRSFGSGSHDGPMIISSNPSSDNLGSELRVVETITEFKAIGGVPDLHFDKFPGADSHITYLAPSGTNYLGLIQKAQSDGCRLQSLLTSEQLDEMVSQMRAYVLGDSRKIPQDQVEMLNALYFPQNITITTGKDIVITAKEPLIITSRTPANLVFGKMTIEPGGYIQSNVPVSITASQIISN